MTYSRGEGDYLGRAGGGRAAFLTKFCFISGSFGAGGTSCQPAARRIVLFPLTFYFCFLFVFASACRAGGDEAGNGAGSGAGTGTGPGRAWHSAWVAHYLMMLFAIFSHLSAWFLLVEFFTVSPAKVSVSCSAFSIVFFACFQCHRTFRYFLFGQNFSSCGWANKDFEIW